MKKNILIFGLLLCGIQGQSFSENLSQVDRYTSVSEKPSTAQLNPLLTVQQIRFPQKVKTVGNALHYWVKSSGFHLVDESRQSEEMKEMMKQPLPLVDRELGPLKVQDGLEVLAGKNVFHLIQDPLHRTVSFTLNSKYALLTNKDKKKRALS